MKLPKLFMILPLFIVASCVSKEEHRSALEKIDELNQQVYDLEDLVNVYKRQIDDCNKKLEEYLSEQRSKPQISEAQAKQYVKDYYAFYKRDWRYKNLQVRRTDKNSFIISLMESQRHVADDDFFYSSHVYRLTVSQDGSYVMENNY